MHNFKENGEWITEGILVTNSNEEVIAQATETEYAKLISAAPELLEAALDFINKVDTGRAKSSDSYNKFKTAVNKALAE